MFSDSKEFYKKRDQKNRLEQSKKTRGQAEVILAESRKNLRKRAVKLIDLIDAEASVDSLENACKWIDNDFAVLDSDHIIIEQLTEEIDLLESELTD